MHVIHSAQDISSRLSRSAVAIGNFDGVHLGHQKLISQLVSYASAGNLAPVILTFYPHPVEVLRPGTKLERLTSTSEKLGFFESLGVEFTLVQSFSSEIAKLSPAAFFQRYLIETLKASAIHVGDGFVFGKGRAGNTEILKKLCESAKVELNLEPPFEFEGEKVSSTLIRHLLIEGNVEKAERLLSRPYLISGPVLHGDNRGVHLGFPTANIHFPAEKVLPKNGVYVTRATWQKQAFLSVTNVGVRPTFHEQEVSPTVETHLIDFTASLYDEFLQLEFLSRLRDEKKFESKEALISQIKSDVQFARGMAWKNST